LWPNTPCERSVGRGGAMLLRPARSTQPDRTATRTLDRSGGPASVPLLPGKIPMLTSQQLLIGELSS
jgi:hypothetical protein